MSPQTGWLLQEEVLPRLKSVIPQVVQRVGCEDAQELIQDATAVAAGILHSAEARGKKVTSGNVAYYAIQHAKSGRRSTGNSCTDVMAAGTQLHGHTRLSSLEEVVASDVEGGGEIFQFHDVLGNNEEDPAMATARKLDWEWFGARLSERERAVVNFLAEGKGFRDVAQAFAISDSGIQWTKRALAQKILAFMGADILVEVRRGPGWRDSLEATRARAACRQERQGA